MNIRQIKKYRVIFWDFDGTIKESSLIKTLAFQELFRGSDDRVVQMIEEHHLNNEGISRYDKIPIYLEWSGIRASEENITHYCNQFSTIVMRQIVDCAWVKGVKEFLNNNPYLQEFILFTAAPQREINEILSAIGLSNIFCSVYGYPNDKYDVVSSYVRAGSTPLDQILVIGDSNSDFLAAKLASVDFCLRATSSNYEVQKKHNGMRFKGLEL